MGEIIQPHAMLGFHVADDRLDGGPWPQLAILSRTRSPITSRSNWAKESSTLSVLFTFTRFPKSQWKSIRTSNAIERLHEEFKRRIKTQTVLPSAETAAMLFWALLASGRITMRKVDGWQTKSLHVALAAATIVSAWLFIHLTFALHYAHEYFDELATEPGKPPAERGGLRFPGTQNPIIMIFCIFLT